MKIENPYTDFQLDVKRCYVPFTVSKDCPKCGQKCIGCGPDDYLSYPVINGREKVNFYCNECDWEESAEIIIRFDVVAAPGS